MPDWSEVTGKLTGRAPVREGRLSRGRGDFARKLGGLFALAGRLLRWLVLTVLLSAGVTALLNESIRDLLWRALR